MLDASYPSEVMVLICDRYRSGSRQDICLPLTLAVLRNEGRRAGPVFIWEANSHSADERNVSPIIEPLGSLQSSLRPQHWSVNPCHVLVIFNLLKNNDSYTYHML